MERTVTVACKPFRMMILQDRRPAGVIGREVDEDTGAAGMHGVHQLAELVQRRRRWIELGKCRIDGIEIGCRKRAAVATHARKSRGHGMDWQQLDDPEPQRADDEVEPGGQGAEGTGGRNHRILMAVKQGDGFQLRRHWP